MGEIAEMILDGTLCEGCRGFIDDESMGFPRYCSPECAEGRGALLPKVRQSQKPRGFKPRKVRRRRAALPATEGGE